MPNLQTSDWGTFRKNQFSGNGIFEESPVPPRSPAAEVECPDLQRWEAIVTKWKLLTRKCPMVAQMENEDGSNIAAGTTDSIQDVLTKIEKVLKLYDATFSQRKTDFESLILLLAEAQQHVVRALLPTIVDEDVSISDATFAAIKAHLTSDCGSEEQLREDGAIVADTSCARSMGWDEMKNVQRESDEGVVAVMKVASHNFILLAPEWIRYVKSLNALLANIEMLNLAVSNCPRDVSISNSSAKNCPKDYHIAVTKDSLVYSEDTDGIFMRSRYSGETEDGNPEDHDSASKTMDILDALLGNLSMLSSYLQVSNMFFKKLLAGESLQKLNDKELQEYRHQKLSAFEQAQKMDSVGIGNIIVARRMKNDTLEPDARLGWVWMYDGNGNCVPSSSPLNGNALTNSVFVQPVVFSHHASDYQGNESAFCAQSSKPCSTNEKYSHEPNSGCSKETAANGQSLLQSKRTSDPRGSEASEQPGSKATNHRASKTTDNRRNPRGSNGNWRSPQDSKADSKRSYGRPPRPSQNSSKAMRNSASQTNLAHDLSESNLRYYNEPSTEGSLRSVEDVQKSYDSNRGRKRLDGTRCDAPPRDTPQNTGPSERIPVASTPTSNSCTSDTGNSNLARRNPERGTNNANRTNSQSTANCQSNTSQLNRLCSKMNEVLNEIKPVDSARQTVNKSSSSTYSARENSALDNHVQRIRDRRMRDFVRDACYTISSKRFDVKNRTGCIARLGSKIMVADGTCEPVRIRSPRANTNLESFAFLPRPRSPSSAVLRSRSPDVTNRPDVISRSSILRIRSPDASRRRSPDPMSRLTHNDSLRSRPNGGPPKLETAYYKVNEFSKLRRACEAESFWGKKPVSETSPRKSQRKSFSRPSDPAIYRSRLNGSRVDDSIFKLKMRATEVPFPRHVVDGGWLSSAEKDNDPDDFEDSETIRAIFKRKPNIVSEVVKRSSSQRRLSMDRIFKGVGIKSDVHLAAARKENAELEKRAKALGYYSTPVDEIATVTPGPPIPSATAVIVAEVTNNASSREEREDNGSSRTGRESLLGLPGTEGNNPRKLKGKPPLDTGRKRISDSSNEGTKAADQARFIGGKRKI